MKGRQAAPRFDPGTLLNQCRLYKNTDTLGSYSFIMMESEGKGNVRKLRLRERKREDNQVKAGIRTLLNLFCQHTLCDKVVSVRRQNSIYLVHCQKESTPPPHQLGSRKD